MSVVVGEDALRLDATSLAWTDLDDFVADGHEVRLGAITGERLTLTHLGPARDRFVTQALAARAAARRAALLQWTGDRPIETFDGKRGDDRVVVCLFPDGLTVEPVVGVPDLLPLSCLVRVERDGYALRLVARGLPDVEVRHLGARTDEFLQRLDRARVDLAARTAAAYAALDPVLADLDAPDGWAIGAEQAGGRWDPLRRAVAGHARAAEIDLLEELSAGVLRLGIKCGAGSTTMPFALAPIGDLVAVEATDADDRATFVFRTTDIDRLNAVLLATSFRREAISASDDSLGRWALAVRTLEVVRWARACFAGRVVHDVAWQQRLRELLP